MNTRNPSFSVPVDVTNPGQFFACCGLLELAYRLWRDAEGWFEQDVFHLYVPKESNNPRNTIVSELCNSELESDETLADSKIAAVLLRSFSFTVDWWIDMKGNKTPLKLWAGRQTSKQIIETLQSAIKNIETLSTEELFQVACPLTRRFGVDPRAAWNALDVGFSPNEQSMKVATFPAVELLAAVGLQGFRPAKINRERFHYATWSIPLPAVVARVASLGILPEQYVQKYRFGIAQRGSYKGFDYATLATGGSI